MQTSMYPPRLSPSLPSPRLSTLSYTSGLILGTMHLDTSPMLTVPCDPSTCISTFEPSPRPLCARYSHSSSRNLLPPAWRRRVLAKQTHTGVILRDRIRSSLQSHLRKTRGESSSSPAA